MASAGATAMARPRVRCNGIDVLRRHRFFQPKQAEAFQLLCHSFTGWHIVEAVHVHGQIDGLGEFLPDVTVWPTMRSISPLLAVRLTRSNRAGSRASSMSILVAVNPAS
jgi:hypothetical protein